MGIVDTIVGLGGSLLWIASLVVAGTGYWWFYRYRTAVVTVAGFTAGLVAGMTVGLGLPALAGGLGGASLGLFAARTHPRGGTLVVGIATGIAFGPLVAVVSTGAITAASSLSLGTVVGIAVAGFGWRFPRTVVVTGTAGLVSVANFAVTLGLGPSITSVSTSSLVEASVFAGETSASVYFVAVTSLVLGPVAQSVLVEYSETVPPLLPAWLREMFEFDENYGPTPEQVSATCRECGAIGDPGHDGCHVCGGVVCTGEYGVPDGAVAVDVPCPHCGERPVEEAATVRTVTGFLIAYRIRTEQYVGCHSCVRRKLWSSAARTALTGWFSITSALINPVMICWNLGRGLVNRGPTLPLVAALNESGVEFEYLDAKGAFDPDAFHQNEVVVRGLINLGCAVMLADGGPSTTESESIRETVTDLFDGYSRDEVESLIERAARDQPELEDVLGGLAETLTTEGRQLALALATAVATADGEMDTRQRSILDTIADVLDLDDAAVAAAEQATR